MNQTLLPTWTLNSGIDHEVTFKNRLTKHCGKTQREVIELETCNLITWIINLAFYLSSACDLCYRHWFSISRSVLNLDMTPSPPDKKNVGLIYRSSKFQLFPQDYPSFSKGRGFTSCPQGWPFLTILDQYHDWNIIQ
jgi:hypothetical protein